MEWIYNSTEYLFISSLIYKIQLDSKFAENIYDLSMILIG